MKNIIVLLLVFLAVGTCHAQMKGHFKDEDRVLSPKEIVNKLKTGALIVRLITKQNTIDYLIKNGKTEVANKIKNEQEAYNKRVVAAFIKNFKFCPVFFIKSSQSNLVQTKQFDKVEFVDSSLNVDKSISFKYNFILTAEISAVEQKKSYHGKAYFVFKNLKSNSESIGQYKKGTSVPFGALVVKSDQFVQLRRPFPYYVRSFESIGILRRSPNTMVQMFQNSISFLAN